MTRRSHIGISAERRARTRSHCGNNDGVCQEIEGKEKDETGEVEDIGCKLGR